MGNKKTSENRRKSQSKQSANQKKHLREIQSKKQPLCNHISPVLPVAPSAIASVRTCKVLDLSHYKKRYDSEHKKNKRWSKKMKNLVEKEGRIRESYRVMEKKNAVLEAQVRTLTRQVTELSSEMLQEQDLRRDIGKQRTAETRRLRRKVLCLQKRIRAAKDAEKTKKLSTIKRLRRGRTYSWDVQQMAREMVLSGTAREKVGPTLMKMGSLLGVKPGTYKLKMSQRTVSRIILEGGIASQVQLAYEMAKTPGKSLITYTSGI
jgi:hypothetical protein